MPDSTSIILRIIFTLLVLPPFSGELYILATPVDLFSLVIPIFNAPSPRSVPRRLVKGVY